MDRFSLRRLLPALLLIVFSLSAVPVEAQRARPIRRGEIQRAQAANLYDLLAAVRPDWLAAGGDTTDLGQARVLVLVGGVPRGTLAGLRGLGTEEVESVRLEMVEEYERRRQLRVDEFAAVLLVQPLEPPERIFVVGSLGTADRETARQVERHLRGNGYGRLGLMLTHEYEPRAVWMLGAGYRLSKLFSAEAVVLKNDGLLQDGIREQDVVQVEMGVTEISVPVAVHWNMLRVGAGPAARLMSWQWASGHCRCEEVVKRNQSTLGLTTLAAVGAGRGRLYAEGRVQMSFYPAESIESYRDISSELIGTRRAVFGAVGVGFRL